LSHQLGESFNSRLLLSQRHRCAKITILYKIVIEVAIVSANIDCFDIKESEVTTKSANIDCFDIKESRSPLSQQIRILNYTKESDVATILANVDNLY